MAKQSKRLTREQKILLSKQDINPRFWRLLQELPSHYIFIHSLTGEVKALSK